MALEVINRVSMVKFGIVSLKEDSEIKNEITNVENMLQSELQFSIRYISFEDNFPTNTCRELLNMNHIPLLTWEFFHQEIGNMDFPLDLLLGGRLDNYIDNFAHDAKKLNSEIYIRLFHEFNFSKHPWSGYNNGAANGGPKKVVQSWLYIINRFKSLNATNVKWIWCPHEPSDFQIENDWNNIDNYWPGDQYADILGMDGFNFFPENPERDFPQFMSFNDLFNNLYNDIQKISDKDIMIMTGTGEFIHDGSISTKTEWINNMFESIETKFINIKYVGWFHYRFNEKVNWKVNSSTKSLEAFRKYLNK